MKRCTRHISDEQFDRFAGYAAEIFAAFGLDLSTPATKDTPRRFIKTLFDATEGYDGDPKLLRVFNTECRGEPECRLSLVFEGPIPLRISRVWKTKEVWTNGSTIPNCV